MIREGLSKGLPFSLLHMHTHPHMHTSTQVSHHPPMFAMHAEHKEWTLWQEYTVASKFRGKYLVCYPIGSCHLMFHRSKSHYTWCKVATTIHNIIVGKLWVDQVRGGVFRGEVVGLCMLLLVIQWLPLMILRWRCDVIV